MQKPTHEQIQASLRSEARDALGPRDPEIMRQMILSGGGSEELADQTARFWEEENRKNGYALPKAS